MVNALNKYIHLKSWKPMSKIVTIFLDKNNVSHNTQLKTYLKRGFSARRWSVLFRRKKHLLANRAIAKNQYTFITKKARKWKRKNL